MEELLTLIKEPDSTLAIESERDTITFWYKRGDLVAAQKLPRIQLEQARQCQIAVRHVLRKLRTAMSEAQAEND